MELFQTISIFLIWGVLIITILLLFLMIKKINLITSKFGSMIYEPLKKGELIPTVEITNIHSQTLNINDLLYDGLNFLLFFSIGCSSCAEALNDLFLNKHIFNDKNIKVILISLNEKNVTDKFFEENGLLSEEVFYVNKPKKAMSDLHITGTPYYILSQQTVIQKAHIVMNNHWKKMLNDIE